MGPPRRVGRTGEPGDTFHELAQPELAEKRGLHVELDDLVPFATGSDPRVHDLTYPNGDRIRRSARWTRAIHD